MTRNSRKMEVIMLSFFVVIPFIMALLFSYFMWKSSDDECSIFSNIPLFHEGFRSITHCDSSGIIGLIQKIYPDDNDFIVKFKCTGLILGGNIAVFLSYCFQSEYDMIPITHMHFITSGSRYWSKDKNIHNIIAWKIINGTKENEASIAIIEVEPSFPDPCEVNKTSFLVEENYDMSSEHTLLGWSTASKLANVEMLRVPFTQECVEYVPSAVIISHRGMTSGFQSVTCNKSTPFPDILIPLSNFVKQMSKEFANINVVRLDREKRELSRQQGYPFFQRNVMYKLGSDLTEESNPVQFCKKNTRNRCFTAYNKSMFYSKCTPV